MTRNHFKSTAYPKISIIIVTYNAASHLQNCLNSIYKQQYHPLEIIIMDGASTDGTVEIIKANDDKIAVWKSEKDDGIYHAMNKALEYITGEWVYFLGADDELFDDFSSLANELNDPGTIYYGSVLKENEKYLGKVSAYKHAKLTICHQAILYPSSIFSKYTFNTDYRISADHVFNMICWRDPEYSFEFRDYILANFNHTGVSSTKKDILFERRKSSLILKNYGLLIWSRFFFRQVKQSIKKFLN